MNKKWSVEKSFKFASGHRLSKHKGLCKNQHGHNYLIIVTISGFHLDENDMLIDFSNLKQIVKPHIEKWDHSLMLNENDHVFLKDVKLDQRLITFNADPTAEVMAKNLFDVIEKDFEKYENIWVEKVSINETDDSRCVYGVI